MECPLTRPCLLREEYLEGENELQVCVDTGGDDWEFNFFQQLGSKDQEQDEDSDIEDIDGDNEDDVHEIDVEPPSLKVTSFKEAIVALEDVSQFLESRGHIQAHSMLGQ